MWESFEFKYSLYWVPKPYLQRFAVATILYGFSAVDPVTHLYLSVRQLLQGRSKVFPGLALRR